MLSRKHRGRERHSLRPSPRRGPVATSGAR